MTITRAGTKRETEKAGAIPQLRAHTRRTQRKLQATEERLSNFGGRQTPARNNHYRNATHLSRRCHLHIFPCVMRTLPHRALTTGITILLSSSRRAFRRTFSSVIFVKHRTLSHNASRISMDGRTEKFARGDAILCPPPPPPPLSLSLSLSVSLYLYLSDREPRT